MEGGNYSVPTGGHRFRRAANRRPYGGSIIYPLPGHSYSLLPTPYCLLPLVSYFAEYPPSMGMDAPVT